MSDRITRANLDERCANVNRRLESTGRLVRIESRNGHYGLDECKLKDNLVKDNPWPVVVRTITVGSKREIAEFLHAMMVGIDLSRTQV